MRSTKPQPSGDRWLTFRATSLDFIRVQRAGFREREPLRPPKNPLDLGRCLLLPDDIHQVLDGKDSVKTGFPYLYADLIVGRFVVGHYLTISQKSAEDVDLEKLENIDDVWALCFRKPRPGWRLLGRFLEPKVFVGFGIYDRHELGPKKNYHAKAEEVITNWTNRFPGIVPFRSTDLGAYVGGHFRDVDEKQ